jgi:Ala-tRNA(Pro) deacylase
MNELFTLLEQLEIPYTRYDHPAFFTIADSEEYLKEHPIPGAKAKSLFLRNRNGDKHYLVVVEGSKRLDMKALGDQWGEKLSFASPERLMQYLKLTPGSVSPLALIHDESKSVQVLLDEDVFNQEKVQFHPLINTATLVLSPKDVLRFIEATGHSYREIQL